MKINNPVDIDQIARDLKDNFDRPFMLIYDTGKNKTHVTGNLEKYEHGNLYMAELLDRVSESLRKGNNK